MNSFALLHDFPVLAQTLSAAAKSNAAIFKGWHVVCVQHLHSSIVPLVDALLLGGAGVADVTVVGKSYSTRPRAVEGLHERGVRVVDPQRMTDPRHSYEIELNRQVTTVLAELESTSVMERLLVLDEGAVATKALTRFPELARRSHVVEQTTRGARWVDQAEVAFPVVDVARSDAKASLEGPLVARSMIEGLDTVLNELGITATRAGIVGYGRMGARLAGELVRRFDVLVHEKEPGYAESARTGGFALRDFDTLVREADILVGCTGGQILDSSFLTVPTHPILLVNGASSDIEFGLWEHRRAEAIVYGDDPARPWANHYTIGSLPGQVTLAAGGFPVNFYGTGEPISAQRFQLTRSLMLAGAVQSMELTRPGLVPLDPDRQAAVRTAYAAAMAEPEAAR
ncbi:hypothetical protein ABZ260_08640 [Streptosporangium sp. NPDC006013]|uniref:hypothetical protein n=1 Tax=Streptosporangium sp. NPDC006013 TaxID=3155596 RepID=UPI00339F7DD6